MKCRHCKDKFIPKVFNIKYCDKELCRSEMIGTILSKVKAKKVKDQAEVFKDMETRVKAPDRKKELGKEVRLLARKIDNYFGFMCIDCGNPYGKQQDAAHLHNSGGNENITYNLHNLHSARAHCNRFSSEHKVGYRKGIEERYGKEYLEYIDIEIPKKYKYIGLNNLEIKEKLAIVRKLNREFDTFKLYSGRQARRMFNKIIGIYK